MSTSLPSKEIYSVDVPEIENFNASFVYNFFVHDEGTSDEGGIPTFALERSGDQVDSQFLQYSTTRVPRYVKFNFSVPKIVERGNTVNEITIRDNVFSSNTQNGSLIYDNIKNVVSEEHFANSNFISTTFNDGEIDEKVYYFASGSLAQQTLQEGSDPNVSNTKAAQRLTNSMPKSVKPHFAQRALAQPKLSHGTSFSKIRASALRAVTSNYFKSLKDVSVNVQINGKLFHDMTNRSIKDPHSSYSSDLHPLQNFASKLKQSIIHRQSIDVSESDYKTFIPFIELTTKQSVSSHHRVAEIVGYIIDKIEVLPDGRTISHDPIIIDNPKVNSSADFKVKYNSTYIYSVRSVAQFTLPAIDDDTGQVAIVKTLISSRPSTRVNIKTTENVAPPPPSDVNFTWDYERVNPTTSDYDQSTGQAIPNSGVVGSLMVHWTFPTNSQRDIKKFQVFRRDDIDSPYELIKMYDFDDSTLRIQDLENPDPSLVETLTSPCTFYFDDDFKKESKYIYCVASTDAHGLTSNYSAQFEIWFDQFKNKLQKRLISHIGAPKPYPNLYLAEDLFVDTIRVAGNNSKKLKLYFNPEYYHVQDDSDRITTVVSTKQSGASYKLQFINLDSQKSDSITIKIDDRRSASKSTTSSPRVKVGNVKRIKR